MKIILALNTVEEKVLRPILLYLQMSLGKVLQKQRVLLSILLAFERPLCSHCYVEKTEWSILPWNVPSIWDTETPHRYTWDVDFLSTLNLPHMEERAPQRYGNHNRGKKWSPLYKQNKARGLIKRNYKFNERAKYIDSKSEKKLNKIH